MRTLHFSAGDVIFREGEWQLTMYEIQKGCVAIVRDQGTEREETLTLLKAGQLFGEMGLLEEAPRSASAVAREDGTEVREIGEEEFYAFYEGKPALLLRLLKQLSARIRENTEKYDAACRALADCLEADRSGTEKSPALQEKLEDIGSAAPVSRPIQTRLRSNFFAYVQEDLQAYEGKRNVVRASALERLTVRRVSPDEMHVNPDDEFCKPEVGPNDRIINEYAHEIPRFVQDMIPVFPEPIMVYKLKPEGYLILNGHHRWAAAVKTGMGKVRVAILNPTK